MASTGTKVAIAALAITASVSAAAAQSRPDTRTMGCVVVRNLVSSRGAMVLTTGPDIFDRFVWTQDKCPHGMITRPAYARTTDMMACHIGYTCETPNYNR